MEEDKDNKNSQIESKEILVEKEQQSNEIESQEIVEKELTDQKIADDEVRAQIEALDLNDELKIQAQSHATNFQSLEDKEKINSLLKVAKEKGIVYAVNVAKKMNNPYILDTLHDALAQEGYYKNFVK